MPPRGSGDVPELFHPLQGHGVILSIRCHCCCGICGLEQKRASGLLCTLLQLFVLKCSKIHVGAIIKDMLKDEISICRMKSDKDRFRHVLGWERSVLLPQMEEINQPS